MSAMWRRPLLALPLLLCVAISGCHSSGLGSPDPQSAGGSQGGGSTQSGGSAQGGGGSQGGAGSQGGSSSQGGGNVQGGGFITIPDVVQSQGMSLSSVENSLETGGALAGETRTYRGIIDQCGGTLCVNFKIVHRNGPGFSPCRFITSPSLGAKVARGSTIVLVVGPGPCTASPSP